MYLRQFTQYILGLVFLVSSSFALSNTEFNYNVIDGGIEVTGCDGTCPSDLVIPAEINGAQVTGIAPNAFSEIGLTSLVLPSTLKKIGYLSFARNFLSTLTIPDGVFEIGSSAFSGNNLTDIVFPQSITNIKSGAFHGNELTEVSFPPEAKYEDSSFWYNSHIENESWKYFLINEKVMLTGCVNSCLSNLEIPEFVDGYPVFRIGSNAFKSSNIANLSLPPNIEYIDFMAFYDNELTNLNLPENLKAIGYSAFGNNYLRNILIPDSIIELGTYAFKNNLISDVTFVGNYNLDLTNVFELNPGYNLGGFKYIKVFSENNFAIVLDYYGQEKNLNIPDSLGSFSITTIGIRAFEDKGLTNVTFPDGITSIGGFAFKDNYLSEVHLPSSVQHIIGSSFSDNNITKIEIPKEFGLYDIYRIFSGNQGAISGEFKYLQINDEVHLWGCFTLCSSELVIPANIDGIDVKKIASFSFKEQNIHSVRIPSTIEEIGSGAFQRNLIRDLNFLGDIPLLGINNPFDENYIENVKYCPSNSNYVPRLIDEIAPKVSNENCDATMDYDGNNYVDALTDGLLLLRYAFGLRGDNLTNAAIGSGSSLTSEEVATNVEQAASVADIDNSGTLDALTDGLILLRYAFGLRGDNLVSGAISSDATRTLATDIEAYIESYMP
jgi:hypothetical protein